MKRRRVIRKNVRPERPSRECFLWSPGEIVFGPPPRRLALRALADAEPAVSDRANISESGGGR